MICGSSFVVRGVLLFNTLTVCQVVKPTKPNYHVGMTPYKNVFESEE